MWDHRADRDSVGAAVFNVWFHKHVRPALMRRLASPAAAPLIRSGDAAFAINYLEQPDTRLGPDPLRARQELLRTALDAATAELTTRLGPDSTQWRWGRRLHALFAPPLAAAFPDDAAVPGYNVGPISKAGDNETLGRRAWRLTDFQLLSGASARFVADTGDWDHSVANNSPGQSGDPRSPHYRDLFEDWANDRYFPLTYSRAAVEKVAEARLVLDPAPALPVSGDESLGKDVR